MRSICRLVFSTTLMLAIGIAAGCGDDDGGGGTPDAAVEIDGAVPDAMLPTVRVGQVGIFEARISNDLSNEATVGVDSLSGSVISTGWDDLTSGDFFALDLDGDGEPDSNVGGCAVKVFDVGTTTDFTETDEGTITVAGSGVGEFSCAFDATDGEYKCASTDALASGAVAIGSQATPLGNGNVNYAFMGAANFPATFVGMALTIEGFPNADANGTFPIVGVTSNILTVVNGDLAALDTTTAAGTYSTSLGETANLVPHLAVGGGGLVYTDFLGGDGDPVTINGPANGPSGALVEDFTSLSICPSTGCEFDPNGEGLVLDSTGSVQPEALPDFSGGGVDLTFTCDTTTDGVCGDFDGGALNALVVSIESTDATTVDGIPIGDGTSLTKQDLLFPSDQAHADIGVTIQCSFIGATTGSVPAAAVQAMLDAHSAASSTITRFKTQVLVVSGAVATNTDNQASTPLFVGHAVAGFTSP